MPLVTPSARPPCVQRRPAVPPSSRFASAASLSPCHSSVTLQQPTSIRARAVAPHLGGCRGPTCTPPPLASPSSRRPASPATPPSTMAIRGEEEKHRP
ncbi:hypothetical protein NL676_008421 [Syzygium grande]|nr:hypothetical protein NL676_008421 [Syzygium grande]